MQQLNEHMAKLFDMIQLPLPDKIPVVVPEFEPLKESPVAYSFPIDSITITRKDNKMQNPSDLLSEASIAVAEQAPTPIDESSVAVDWSGIKIPEGGLPVGQMSMLTSGMGSKPEVDTSGVEKAPKDSQFVDLSRSKRGKLKGKKKGAARRQHFNMGNARNKAMLGVHILSKLGKIQRDTQDSVKRTLLETLPMSALVQSITDEQIPEYQKNLMDLNQARQQGREPLNNLCEEISQPGYQEVTYESPPQA